MHVPTMGCTCEKGQSTSDRAPTAAGTPEKHSCRLSEELTQLNVVSIMEQDTGATEHEEEVDYDFDEQEDGVAGTGDDGRT